MASKQKSSKKVGKLKKIFGKLHLWFGLIIGYWNAQCGLDGLYCKYYSKGRYMEE